MDTEELQQMLNADEDNFIQPILIVGRLGRWNGFMSEEIR
jgi:hypothetical protein